MNARKFFHVISYLQYPLVLGAFYFYLPFIKSISQGELDFKNLDYFLILLGVGLSFSTLQDTTKTQNKLSKRIWQNPKAGKTFLFILAALTFSLIFSGIVFLFVPIESALKHVAAGITVLGIGLLGLLKAAIEMFENHRLDKNPESK